ncbi:MAG: TIGR00266 family protein [Actinobacteria bacterium]|nr:TIGR00266 family protein [Actinomycetota bacterium]
MDVEFQNGPAFTVAVARLAGGEKLRAESGAMISMTTGTQIETTTQGGILKGLKRSLSGESFFMNMFTAPPSGGEILLAASLPGDMTYVDLQGQTWLFHRDGFVASEATIELDTKWGGLKGAFGASSFFVVKCSGQGKAIVATYGALRRVDLQAGQQYTVDSGHLVAWPESLPIEVHKVGGMKSLFLSGEGFVVTLTGPGTFYMQTRSEAAFVSWLVPYLPKSGN